MTERTAGQTSTRVFSHGSPRRATVNCERLTFRGKVASIWRLTLECGHVIERHKTFNGNKGIKFVYCIECRESATTTPEPR